MKISLKTVITSVLLLSANVAMAIPKEVTNGLTAQATEVGTYTGPAVVLALAVVSAGAAIKWTKRFVSRAL